jgi:hypothetical protein
VRLKILDALKTAALFLIAAGLFAMSYVIYDVMGKHGRYVPVTYEEDQIVVMDTHTGHVWSKSFELKEATDFQTPDPINGKIQSFPRKLIVKVDQ